MVGLSAKNWATTALRQLCHCDGGSAGLALSSRNSSDHRLAAVCQPASFVSMWTFVVSKCCPPWLIFQV